MTSPERNRRRRRNHPTGPQVGAPGSPSAVPTTSTTSTGIAAAPSSGASPMMMGSSPNKRGNRNTNNHRNKMPNYREAAIEVAAFVSDKNDVVSRTVRGILETNGVGRREAAANRYLKNALGIRTSNNVNNATTKILPADASDHPFQRSFRAKLREATDVAVVEMLMVEARQQSMPELIAVAERKLRLLQQVA